MFDMQSLLSIVSDNLASHLPRIGLAVVTLAIGWWVIGWLQKGLHRWFLKTDFDEGLESFIESLAGIALKLILIVVVAGMVGIETTALIGVLSAMAFAIGLALQGSLANFAGGVLILVFKPFSVGDFIESGAGSGTVEKIRIFDTLINTIDNRKIYIPNGELSNNPITNYSANDTRRLHLVFGIGYNDDIKKAKDILAEMVAAEDRFHTEPAPQIFVANLGDSAVDIEVRAWVATGDYLDVQRDMLEAVKLRFDAEGISIPFPQRDVHLYQQ